MRLNKYIASCGICSRREADKLIESGKVFVNQKPAQNGQDVSDSDLVTIQGKKIKEKPRKTVLAYYKPRGVVCSEKDKHAEKIISDMVKYPTRITYAGRLDKESEGLLLLTNDGDLIEHMMRGANKHEKEYIVKVNKEITPDFLKKMQSGINLPELNVMTRECEVQKIGKFTFSIILTQGLNRQIRRMCEKLNYKVVNLKRIRVMQVKLDNLRPNEWRELQNDELQKLYQSCGLAIEDTK